MHKVREVVCRVRVGATPASYESSELSDIAAGDIVECINDTPSRPESTIMPSLGGLYIVCGIRPTGDGYSVRLKELTPICHLGGVCACKQCGWDAARFQKVYRPSGDLIAALTRPVCRPA